MVKPVSKLYHFMNKEKVPQGNKLTLICPANIVARVSLPNLFLYQFVTPKALIIRV